MCRLRVLFGCYLIVDVFCVMVFTVVGLVWMLWFGWFLNCCLLRSSRVVYWFAWVVWLLLLFCARLLFIIVGSGLGLAVSLFAFVWFWFADAFVVGVNSVVVLRDVSRLVFRGLTYLVVSFSCWLACCLRLGFLGGVGDLCC